jgi:hypothetical protein
MLTALTIATLIVAVVAVWSIHDEPRKDTRK